MQKRVWAEEALAKLKAGETVGVKPTGNSMQGRISSGDLVTIEPCRTEDLAAGDIVLARIRGRCHFHLVLHLVIECGADKFLIGNNHGRIDGWVMAEDIFGKAIEVQTETA